MKASSLLREAFRKYLGDHGPPDFNSRGKCFEALSHSLNAGIAKNVMFNYKEISTDFQWGNCLTNLQGESAKEHVNG